MNVQIDGQQQEISAPITFGQALKQTLSGKKFKTVIAASARFADTGQTSPEDSWKLVDLSAEIPADCIAIAPVYMDSPDGLRILRHSSSHVLAAAVKNLFPDVKIAIGPAIDNGFYYDFDFERAFSSSDFAAIEEEMRKIADAAIPFEHKMVSKDDALAFFRNQGENYKVELIEAIPDAEVGLYTIDGFTDLCRGPHAPHTGFAVHAKPVSAAGAYWHGDEKNRMLSRIYGTAWPTKKELDNYLHSLEEARARDHRKLGRELAFFDFEEAVAPGMVFWLPKGMLTRTILEDFWRREHLKRGYEIVQGPQLLRVETWQKSGHYEHYRENMYFTRIEDDAYGIKPMNCIGHMLIYGRDLHSYRDLPKRYFELGVVHRHEKSGVLHGLLRVRQFTQDDAHIICAPEQLENEILGVIHLIRDLMNLFDFRFKVAISTRPESSIGTDEAWEQATGALTQAVEKAGLPYEINAGDGAFYGPKIDVSLLDCLGRQWQCSTIQVDFTLPERFDLSYIASDGEKRRPVMVHRAIMGSVERFIGILIENFAGALPIWLAPEQARILTVTQAVDGFAAEARTELLKLGIRAHLDDRNEKLGFKVREAQLAKVPYMLIVGEKEMAAGALNVRLRNGDNIGLKSTAEVVELIREDSEKPFKQGGMSYSFA